MIPVALIIGVIFGIAGTSLYHTATKNQSSAPQVVKSYINDSVNGYNDADHSDYNPPNTNPAKQSYDDSYKQSVLDNYHALRVAYAMVKLNEPNDITVLALSTHPRLNTVDSESYPWFAFNPDANLYVSITTPIAALTSMTERIVAPIYSRDYSWQNDDFVVAVSREHYDQILATVGARNTVRPTKVTLSQKNAELLLGTNWVPSGNLYYIIPMN